MQSPRVLQSGIMDTGPAILRAGPVRELGPAIDVDPCNIPHT